MWIRCPNPRPQARLRLFCIPYAGGSVGIYQHWTKLPLTGVEICLVKLAGHGARLAEASFTRMNKDCKIAPTSGSWQLAAARIETRA